MKSLITTAIIGCLCICLTACPSRKAGPMEKTGERMDEIKDNIEEEKPMLHKKGSLEKTGEAIDEALGTDDR